MGTCAVVGQNGVRQQSSGPRLLWITETDAFTRRLVQKATAPQLRDIALRGVAAN